MGNHESYGDSIMLKISDQTREEVVFYEAGWNVLEAFREASWGWMSGSGNGGALKWDRDGNVVKGVVQTSRNCEQGYRSIQVVL